ncbi:BrnT family toxin [Gallibacterium anatis]|uniref:BrnT family toxin n=1 Tax=Gallibacterium anatis TaxID=750 RepID=UPI0030043BA5
MKIEFDAVKNQQNIQSRQLCFQQAAELDWQQALIWQDDRFEYGEIRYSALALSGNRLHFICFKFIPNGIRVISFRKANKREIKKYENERQSRV